MAKTLNLVYELMNKGYNINFRIRSDGGIIVKEINGEKFSGAKGNEMIRILSNVSLSEKQQSQLLSIKPKKLDTIPKEIKSQLRKTQKVWRKKRSLGGLKNTGKVTSKKVRYRLKTYGVEATLSFLKESEKYAQGYAYTKNVDILLQKIDNYIEMLENFDGDEITIDYLKASYELILNHRDTFPEAIIYDLYQLLYSISNGSGDPKELYNFLKSHL